MKANVDTNMTAVTACGWLALKMLENTSKNPYKVPVRAMGGDGNVGDSAMPIGFKSTITHCGIY